MSLEMSRDDKKKHIIEQASVNNGILYINIDGKNYNFELRKLTVRLAKADDEQLKHFEISPSGYGIHWPDIDEDISIDGLIGIIHRPTISTAKNI